MIRVTHVAAADDMGTQTPDIPPLGDGRTRSRLNIGGSHLLNRVRHRRVDRERHVDLDRVETGQIEIKAELQQIFEFTLELCVIPPGRLANAVQRKAEGPDLGLAAILDDNHRDLVIAELAHCSCRRPRDRQR